MLELSTNDPTRPLTASTFFADLAEEFDDLTLSQVGYHLSRLKDAELLAAGRRSSSDGNSPATTRRPLRSKEWARPSP
ncbi:MAG: hypothetical protein ACTHO8_07260 [Solirubrobacterales bacterium]